MARASATSARRLAIAGGAVVSLVVATILLWPSGGADQAPAGARPTEAVRSPRTAPDTPQPAAPPAPAPQVVLPTQAAPAPAASDPFRAFLEAHRDGAAPAASQPALAAPVDPFKAAMEAASRAAPVPLVSPFGGKQ